MNSRIFIFILFLFIPFCSHSQIVIGLIFGDKLNSPKMETGVHLGVNFSSFTNTHPEKMLSHIAVGLYNKYDFNERLFLDSRLYAHFSGGAKKLDIKASSYSPTIDSTNVERIISYLGAGSALGYQISKKFSASAGILGLLRSGARDVHETENGDQLIIKNRKFTNAIDFGITANTYYQSGLTNNGLLLGIGFYYGFLTISKGQNAHNLIGQVFVGIPLGKRK